MAKYIGKRCIPLNDGEHDKTKKYESLTIVLDSSSGDSYISKKDVPSNTELSNTDYWVLHSKYSQQVANLYKNIDDVISKTEQEIERTEEVLASKIPTDIVKAAVDTYVEANSGGFATGTDLDSKIDKPTVDGIDGQVLGLDTEGNTVWKDSMTELEDGSITESKLGDDLYGEIQLGAYEKGILIDFTDKSHFKKGKIVNNVFIQDDNASGYYTDYIDCITDESLSISDFVASGSTFYLLYDENKNFLQSSYGVPTSSLENLKTLVLKKIKTQST